MCLIVVNYSRHLKLKCENIFRRSILCPLHLCLVSQVKVWGFTLLKSTPLAQEHLLGSGTSFHTNFFILRRNTGFIRFHPSNWLIYFLPLLLLTSLRPQCFLRSWPFHPLNVKSLIFHTQWLEYLHVNLFYACGVCVCGRNLNRN